MSRLLTLLIALAVLIAAYMMLRNLENRPESDPKTKVTNDPAIESPAMISNQTASNFHDWREFASKSGDFKVLLPSLPQHVTDTLSDPKTGQPRKYETFAIASDHGAALMINAITFSSSQEANDSEESLKSVINEMLERNKENKLNTITSNTFRGERALDFSLKNGDVLIEGKVFAHKKTIYILSVLNKKEAFNKKELDFFINSFEFVDHDKLSSESDEEPAAVK